MFGELVTSMIQSIVDEDADESDEGGLKAENEETKSEEDGGDEDGEGKDDETRS